MGDYSQDRSSSEMDQLEASSNELAVHDAPLATEQHEEQYLSDDRLVH